MTADTGQDLLQGFGPVAALQAARWIPVRLPDSPVERTVLTPGDAYVSIELLDFSLSRPRALLSRFHPLLMSSLVFPQRLARLSEERVIDMSRPIDGTDAAPASHGVPLRQLLCAQVPFHGRLEGSLHLVALRSEAALRGVMRLAKAFQAGRSRGEPEPGLDGGDLPSGAHEDPYESVLASVAAAKVAELAGKLAGRLASRAVLGLVSEAAGLILEQDGKKNVRLSVRAGELPHRSGDYVLCRPAGGGAEAELDYDPALRQLRRNGKRLGQRDYVIVRVTASHRHEAVDLIPGLGEDYRALMEILISEGDPSGALRRFRRRALASEYLIDRDRDELIALVETRARAIAGDLAQARQEEGTHEAALAAPRLRQALPSLSGLWHAGLRQARSGAQVHPPESRGPVIAPSRASAAARHAKKAPVEHTPSQGFERALTFALEWEGGYVNHPADRGGPTNKGVTQAVYDAWRAAQAEPMQSVEYITHDEMRAIYKANYWQAGRCDRFRAPLDWLVFDTAVNSGPAGAARILQRALAQRGAPVRVDGVIGPRTIAAAAGLDEQETGRAFISERLALFDRIVEKRPEQRVFLRGWRNRVLSLARATGLDAGHESLAMDSADSPAAEAPSFHPADYID